MVENFKIDGLDVGEIARGLETPFFLFSQNILENQYRIIKDGLSENYPNNKIYYSAKTNFEEAVLKILLGQGSQLEIACGHEFFIANKIGFKAQDICFDGAVKTQRDLKYVIENGPVLINMDNKEEAKILDELSKSLGKKIRVGFRINPEMQGFLRGPAVTYIRKFGIPISQARALYGEVKKNYGNLEIVSVSAHIGSQITSIEPYKMLVRKLIGLVKDLKQDGITIEEVNLGGGFPSASLIKLGPIKFALSLLGIKIKSNIPSLVQYAREISKEFSVETSDLENKPVLAVEPGRSIASSMGILVSRVAAVKSDWLFLDSSKYAISESIFFSQNQIVPVHKNGQPVKNYNIAGSSLNTGDIIALNKKLPVMKSGDLVAILDAGAYSLSRAVQFTVLDPPVYLIDKNKKLRLIRRAGQYQDLTLKTVST